MKKLRIFAASPSDMATERGKVEAVATMLKPLADSLDIVLDVADWRAVAPDMGRPEQVILDQLKPTAWDVFIGILWHRFGTPPGGRDPQTQKEYLAGTEEEFKTARRLWNQFGKPRIMMYRCTRAVPTDALDPDQFKRVKEFFAEFDAIKGGHPGLYESFDTADAFEKLLLKNLEILLLEYAEQIRGKPVAPEIVQAYAPKTPYNLPRRAPFFGRDREMNAALRALSPEDRTWGLLVDGIGGIGKSALAVEAAYRCKEKGLFDAFIFISAKQNILAPGGIRELTPAAGTLDEFLNQTARALVRGGIPQLAGDGKRRALLDALRSTRALLIYDNLETLTKEEQEAMADFLRELPQECKAIITSRRRGGEGALWLRLEKLEWEASRAIIKSQMALDPQLADKLRRVSEARWQELYDETKGSPLALVHTLGLMRVRAALTFDGALELLRGNRAPDLQKFIFREARHELTPNDEAALRALSLFLPSAAFEAWMEVAALSRNALETSVDRLSALSLVDVLAGAERYALHPLTRNFVRDELLTDTQIANETSERFVKYWVDYAKRYGRLSEDYKTFDLLETEMANLYVAADSLWHTRAVQEADVADKNAARMLNDMARELARFLLSTGHWDEQIQLSTWGYESARALNDLSAAGWRAHSAAWVVLERGDAAEAARWVDRCAEAWSPTTSKEKQADVAHLRGLVAKLGKDYDGSERFLKIALMIRRDSNLDEDIGRNVTSLGNLEMDREAYDAAERYFRESLDIDKKRGDKGGMAVTLGNLAELEVKRGRWGEARELCKEGLQLARELGQQYAIAHVAYVLALVHEKEGHPDLALPLAQESLAIEERLRSKDLGEARELVQRLSGKVDSKSKMEAGG